MKSLLRAFCIVSVLVCGLAGAAQAGIPRLPAAALTIDSPTNRQQFIQGATIPIQATAVDPNGAILRVEFFAEAQRIGVSEIATLVPVPPGTPVQHQFEWEGAAAGSHILTVRAVDSTGSLVISAPVVIRVGDDQDTASIRIIAPEDLAEFTGGDDVSIVAEAVDPAGLIDVVEFFANNEKIGESHFNFCPPCDHPPCPLGPCILPPAGTVLTHAYTWTNPPTGKYALEVRGTTASGESIVSPAIRIVVAEAPTKASLTFTAPKEGETFKTPGLVSLEVTAVDPQSEIRRVEFFADDQRLGVSEILTKDAIIPGRPRVHDFVWTNPPAGPHTLLAKAKDATSREVTSDPRHILVEGETSLPVVTVMTAQRFSLEGDRLNSGLFELHRTGDLSLPLPVQFEMSGAAQRGADYTLLLDPCWVCDRADVEVTGNTVIFPEGRDSLILGVLAAFDGPTVVEPTVESVDFLVVKPPVVALPGAQPPYEPGADDTAEVLVVDRADPNAAGVIITSPVAGQKLHRGTPVTVEAVAVDPLGAIERVEFFAGDHPIGVSEILTDQALFPGQLLVHHVTWQPDSVGDFKLHASTKTSAGTVVESNAVLVHVGDDATTPTVTIATGKSPALEHGDLKSRFGSFQVTRQGGDKSQPLTVFYLLGGSAIAGADYQLLLQTDPTPDPNGSILRSLVIPSGESSATIAFQAVPDDLVEGTETVVATLVEPPFANPLPSNYLLGDPHEAQVEILDANSSAPSVVLSAPTNQAAFTAPATIHVEATAVHPDLGIISIQFYANGSEIGHARYCCDLCPCAVPLGGVPFTGAIDWTNVKAGDYTLVAEATAFGDVLFKSSPITIHVLGTGPHLTITQPTNGAAVRADQKTKVVAVGIGRLGGITDVDLLLDGQKISESHLKFFRPPGADEPVQHEFEVLVPQGEHDLVVRDEFDATVISPTVRVKSIQPNPPATLTWVSPAADAKFTQGTPIDLEVKAVDPLGLIFHADFFADGKRLGGADFNCPECRLAPGATIALGFQWTNAPKGRHVLWATAQDSAGHEVVSKHRGIEVTARPAPRIAAARQLPAVFLRGTKFTVSIEVKPNAGVQNYVVEEHPPFVWVGGAVPPPDQPLWTVTAISDDGVLDPTTGAVKFGPFLDHQTRTLTYEITPNAAAVDTATFDGVAVADGKSVTIGGDTILKSSVRHPADDDPADDSISAAELTAYGAAWKAGHTWSSGPNPIPMDYVTRAGALWRGGERYRFDPTAGPAPLWWVSDPLLVPAVPLGAGGSGNNPAEKSQFSGVALRSLTGGNEKPWEVALRVLLAPGTNVFALEEHLPGTPTAISDDGVFDSATQTIRWGPFLDHQPRVLKYQLGNADSPQSDRGMISFDGRSFVVHWAPPGNATNGPRLVSLEAADDGARQIVLEDEALLAGAGYDLEVSTDLGHWTRVGGFVNENTAGFARDEAPVTTGPRFYRAVRVK